MINLEPRLAVLESKIETVSSKIDRLDTRVSSMSGNITMIAERLTRKKIWPLLLVLLSVCSVILIIVMA